MRSPWQTQRIGMIFVLLLTSLSATAQTQQPPLTDEATEVPNTVAITGRVINENGQPLHNAVVVIRAFGLGGQARGATTDRDGTFQFDGLERLVYFFSAMFPAHIAPARDPDSTQATYYRVGDSATIVLVKGGVITGSVTTSGDEPIVGVRVRAQMIRDGNGQPSRYGAMLREQNTDDRGIYRIYGLPSGTYLIMAGGGGSFWSSGLSPLLTDRPTYAPSSTRDTAGEIVVRAGEETTNVDIRHRGESGHMVSGTATGPQAEEPRGFNLTLSSTVDAGSQWSNQAYQPPSSSGFVFYGVADGDYDVTAQTYFPKTGEWNVSEPKRIRVRGTDINGVEISTKPLPSISGRVVLEDSKAPECKGKRRPLLTETLVSAWHNEKEKAKDRPQFIWSLGTPSTPDKQGDFSLRNLAPGQYHFVARLFPKYWYLKSISLENSTRVGTKPTEGNRSRDAMRNWTALKAGDRLSGLVFTLAEGAASLRGQVTIADDKELPPRLYVYLVPAESEKAEDVLRFFAAPVSADGKIVLNNLAPGRYWIVAQPAIESGLSPLAKLRLPDEIEIRATLRRDAEAAKTEIEFKPCQNVTDYQLVLKSFETSPAKKTEP